MQTQSIPKTSFIGEVSVFIKKQKELFAAEYFKDIKIEEMTFVQRKSIYADYNNKWAEKETKLYKAIAKTIKIG